MTDSGEAGAWWLPGDNGRVVSGLLIVQPHGPVALDLLGSWHDDEPEVRLPADPAQFSQDDLDALDVAIAQQAEAASEKGPAPEDRPDRAFPAQYPVVHGVQHGQALTLLNLSETRRDAASTPGFPRSRYSVGVVVRGGHTGDLHVTRYRSLHVQFEHLTSWCNLALLAPDQLRGGPQTDRTPALGPHRALTVGLDDGAEVRLGHRSGSQHGLHERRHWREAQVQVLPSDPLPLRDLYERYLVPLRALLTTATGTASALTRMAVTTDEVTWNRQPVPLDVIVADDAPAPTGRSLHEDQMALPLSQVDATRLLPNWFRVHETHQVAARFAYTQRHADSAIGEERLLTGTAAVEALHASQPRPRPTQVSARPDAVKAFLAAFPQDEQPLLQDRLRHLSSPTLRTRLDDLVAQADDLFSDIAPDPKRWVAQVVRARNDVAHGNRQRHSPSHVLALAESCGHLVELCLLLEAGADRAVLRERLPRSSHHRLITAHAQSVLHEQSPQP